jgi:hypothetical protein
MPEKMKRLEIRFQPEEIERLTEEASNAGVSRSQLIRDRALGVSQSQPTIAPKPPQESKRKAPKGQPKFTPQTYNKAVESAAMAVAGIPRTQIEHIVARVINSIAA